MKHKRIRVRPDNYVEPPERVEELRVALARIILDHYDRHVRPRLKRTYTLPGEPQRMGVPVRVRGGPTKPQH